jgi:hypothetical protein
MVVIGYVVSLSKENRFLFTNATLLLFQESQHLFEEDGSNFGHDY